MKTENLLFEVNTLTPLMEQYYSMKAKHPDAILLYRVGDFYETFSTDAIHTSNVLGIVLTKEIMAVRISNWQDFHITHWMLIYQNSSEQDIVLQSANNWKNQAKEKNR